MEQKNNTGAIFKNDYKKTDSKQNQITKVKHLLMV